VRQLAAAAGDGSLGFAGSPGQLETSLNSGYTVGPCNSYLEGPTLVLGVAARAILVWACSRIAALDLPSLSSRVEERTHPHAPPHHGRAAIPTLAAAGPLPHFGRRSRPRGLAQCRQLVDSA
jgi:hypothetical protein